MLIMDWKKMCKEWLKMDSCSRDSVFKQRNYLKDVLQLDFVFVFQPFEQRIWKRIKKMKKRNNPFSNFFFEGKKWVSFQNCVSLFCFSPRLFLFLFLVNDSEQNIDPLCSDHLKPFSSSLQNFWLWRLQM